MDSKPARTPTCPLFCLPAVHPAIRLACRLTRLRACRHTGRQADLPTDQPLHQQVGLNIMGKQYGTKDGNKAIDFLYFSEE
ncbi:hypothetical protein [Bacteroides caecigallinarum]|uniref:hypothetical protein n=1 Tax=Bacteroides caecigallinarum TaxID=1411144 RepID=UPI001F2B4A66|nr:hypothetical protein [Bacteroides caecigallinarum]MCF2583090.1 hypothetical protein [Bacteroides caecigallinarum]